MAEKEYKPECPKCKSSNVYRRYETTMQDLWLDGKWLRVSENNGRQDTRMICADCNNYWKGEISDIWS